MKTFKNGKRGFYKMEQDERIQQILKGSFINQYLEDEGVTDISYNGKKLTLQHNQKGRYAPEKQPDTEEVKKLIKKIADAQKKELTNSEPIMDTEIDFLRVNAVHDSVSPDGMSFSVRVSRPRLAVSSISDMTVGNTQAVEDLLKILVYAGSNIIVSGRTGAGKTELQKLLVNYTKDDDIIVLAEDTRDSHIKRLYPQKDIKSWQTLLSDEREKKVTMQDLVRAGLRNNPDWIIISETRGEEAADMLDSAKTDHSNLTTIHAKGAMNIPSRLIPMIRSSEAYAVMNDMLVGREIVEFLRFGVHLQLEIADGKISRHIKEIVEFTDFTEKGAEGRHLYHHLNVYDEATGTYHSKEVFNPLSDESLTMLRDKKLIHLLPDVFNKKKEGAGVNE